MKTRYLILAAVSVLAAVFCLNSCSSGEPIPFETVEHYYYRNDAPPMKTPKINTANDFFKHFGMGSVMGEDGHPTFVNFKEKFVIAVVPPKTDVATELIPVSVTKKGETLTFTYEQKKGEKLSYIMQPVLLVAVDRQYGAPKVVVKKK